MHASIDDCESTVGMFIDLKKAFDTLYHDILIKKTLSLWYKSYVLMAQVLDV